MRSYLLTERERKILKTYIEENVKLDGFSVLSLRRAREYPLSIYKFGVKRCRQRAPSLTTLSCFSRRFVSHFCVIFCDFLPQARYGP